MFEVLERLENCLKFTVVCTVCELRCSELSRKKSKDPHMSLARCYNAAHMAVLEGSAMSADALSIVCCFHTSTLSL